MSTLEEFVSRLATDADCRRALAEDPEAAVTASGLTLCEAERSALVRLSSLLALPPDELRQGLLRGETGDPWLWFSAQRSLGQLGS